MEWPCQSFNRCSFGRHRTHSFWPAVNISVAWLHTRQQAFQLSDLTLKAPPSSRHLRRGFLSCICQVSIELTSCTHPWWQHVQTKLKRHDYDVICATEQLWVQNLCSYGNANLLRSTIKKARVPSTEREPQCCRPGDSANAMFSCEKQTNHTRDPHESTWSVFRPASCMYRSRILVSAFAGKESTSASLAFKLIFYLPKFHSSPAHGSLEAWKLESLEPKVLWV